LLRRRSRLRLEAKSRDQHALIDKLRTGETGVRDARTGP